MTSLSTTRCWLERDRVHRGDEARRVRLRVLPARRRLRDERRRGHQRVDDPARAPVVAGGALVIALGGDRQRQQDVGVRAGAEARVEAVAGRPSSGRSGSACGRRTPSSPARPGPRRRRAAAARTATARMMGRAGRGMSPTLRGLRLPRPWSQGGSDPPRVEAAPTQGHAPLTSRSTRRARYGHSVRAKTVVMWCSSL